MLDLNRCFDQIPIWLTIIAINLSLYLRYNKILLAI